MNQQDPEVLTPEEYAAIDLVPPHQPGDGIPLSTAVERAKARTAAWLGAHEVIEKSA
ncbi:MAG: hypothetical protein QE269_07165 [Fimbriimonas sp.]|nr:hypothetical protein [Fimbriimonas sp.]